MMIKLTHNGEGSKAAPDTYRYDCHRLEEWVNDPVDSFNFTNEELLGLLDLRAFKNTAGDISVQNN